MASTAVTSTSFSFRPPVPPVPAVELLTEIRERGGRVYRMQVPDRVFCLTNDPKLAAELADRGAKAYTTLGLGLAAAERGYPRERNGTVREFDLWIHTIPVEEGTTLWEAAG